MSTLSKLFSGYTGSGQIVKNGKFSTTKNNHNHDRYNRPTVMYGYSRRYLALWFDKNKIENIIKDAKLAVERREVYNIASYIYYACNKQDVYSDLPSYLNPIYHRAYHQPKHRR